MAKFKPVKKTTFLEAVAAAIEHEKRVFEFYARNAETLPEGQVKTLFFQLAEDVDDHIQFIHRLYSDVQGGESLPNLKMLSQVHKFNSTSLSILMRRLDRNTEQDSAGDEIEAVTLATREHEDAADFFRKCGERFEDPNIRNLFVALANFQDENRMLLESYLAYQTQGAATTQPEAYWDKEDLEAAH